MIARAATSLGVEKSVFLRAAIENEARRVLDAASRHVLSPEDAARFQEVLVRQLSINVQYSLPRPWWPWATSEGRLDFQALLEAFCGWWRNNADALGTHLPAYPEAVPHLALCAFLQRVVNGGGRVHREFAAGRGAMDLLIEYGPDRFGVEIKRVRDRDGLETIVSSGVTQLTGYLEALGLPSGWLVVFDVRAGRSWEDRLWQREVEHRGHRITVLGA